MHRYISRFPYLEQHPDLLVQYISWYYPLSERLINRHFHLLNWNMLSSNDEAQWNMRLIRNYRHLLFIGDSGGLRQDEKSGVHLNTGLPWSIELIEMFYDKWDWQSLSEMKPVMGNETIRRHFIKELGPWMNDDNWVYLETQRNMFDDAFNEFHNDYDSEEEDNPGDYFDQEYELFNHPLLLSHDVSVLEKDEVDWDIASDNINFPWSIELIERYKDHWDWGNLSCNESLPWCEDLIDRFAGHWVWGGISDPDEKGSRYINYGLITNAAIPYNEYLINKYFDKIDWGVFSSNNGIHWSESLLQRYSFLWNTHMLLLNRSLWDYYLPLLSEKVVDRLLWEVWEMKKVIALN